jgi:RNA polymerase sigma-70 factor (ECF subfamily)
MAKTMAKQHVSSDASETRDDATLLRAVAQERDKHAFDALVSRYENFLFSLAVHITGSTELAEETYQEAMMRVWSSAGSYRGEGVVKAWLVRIVVREGVRLSKSRKKKHQPQQSDMESLQTVDTHSPSPLHSAESAELAGALLAEFKRLPELDRQVVGLHFGGGMTQQEIGQALSVPQQTVSYRLNEALRHLRSTLTAGGYAIGVPAMFAKIFGDALCTGATVPPGLRERVMARIAARGSMRSRRSPKLHTAPTLAGKALAAAAVVMMGGAAFWASSQSRTSTPVPVVPAIQPAAEAKPSAAAASIDQGPKPTDELHELPGWRKTWAFDKGFPSDVIAVGNDWKLNPQNGGIDFSFNGRFFPAYTLPSQPLLFTAKATIIDLTQSMHCGLTIYKNGVRVPKLWRKDNKLANGNLTYQFYLYHRTLVGVNDGQKGMLNELPDDVEHGVLLFSFSNVSVKELSVRPLTEDEVPDFVKNPELLKGELEPYTDPYFHPEKK